MPEPDWERLRVYVRKIMVRKVGPSVGMTTVDDLTQEVLVKVWRFMRPGDNLVKNCNRVIDGVISNHFRTRGRRTNEVTLSSDEWRRIERSELPSVTAGTAVGSLLDELTGSDRFVAQKIIEGESFAEIGRQLGRGPAHVNNCRQRIGDEMRRLGMVT